MEVALSGVEVVERDILAVLFLPFELIDVMMMMMRQVLIGCANLMT